MSTMSYSLIIHVMAIMSVKSSVIKRDLHVHVSGYSQHVIIMITQLLHFNIIIINDEYMIV